MQKNKLRIVFAGTPDFAVPCLKALLAHDYNVVAVFTQPDRPKGRGQKILPSPIKQVAEQFHLPLFQPESFKNENAIQQLKALEPDLMIVVAYGLLLPQSVLSIPSAGCINVHASLLPRWRGAAPIQRALLAGDNETGITIMQMELGLDTGPMLYKVIHPISEQHNARLLHDELSILGADALIEALKKLEKNEIIPVKQNDELACYATKIDKKEAKINWQQSAKQIHNMIRAFNPWPGAYTLFNEQIIKIYDGVVVNSTQKNDFSPGQIIAINEQGIDVQTTENTFKILQLQLAGNRILTVNEFVRGNPLKIKVRDQFA